MSDHPIIFSAPMVRALLDGRKTMTRRLAWRDQKPDADGTYRKVETERLRSPWQRVKPGDRLWVRETWQQWTGTGWLIREAGDGPSSASTVYCADHDHPERGDPLFGWHSSIHMPRWASRLTLIVTATVIER